jgi:hypothetical protein
MTEVYVDWKQIHSKIKRVPIHTFENDPSNNYFIVRGNKDFFATEHFKCKQSYIGLLCLGVGYVNLLVLQSQT